MATFEEACAGLDAGITYGTHLFNAMPALDHRAPGLAGALLTDPRVTVGVIPDGVHLHPAVVKLIWQSKGPAGVNMVTDAMAALGMPPGQYNLGDFIVTVDGTSARLGDSRLAGSILSLDQALRNFIAFTGCSLSEALMTVTTTPARVLGLTDRGQIAPGFIADMVLLTPDLHIVKTFVGGQIGHEFH
jgi:N-acetylglucosamine-6-phosphate deacetylase